MSRFSYKQYRRKVMLAMAIYVACMLLVWPLVQSTTSLPLKVLLALAPVLPMFYVIGLMARRIRDSDELEQRTHLIALGTATVVVGALSLVGGFLAAAHVLQLDGAILIWIFPTLLMCYGATRWWVARRYGVSLACEDVSGMPMYLRFLLVAMVMIILALMRWPTSLHWPSMVGDRSAFLLGMAAPFAVIGTVLGIGRWRARHHRHDGGVR